MLLKAAADRAGDVTSWLLSMPLAKILPARGSAGAKQMERVVAGAVARMLASRETIYAVRDIVSNTVRAVASRPVAEVSRELSIPEILSDRLLPAVSEERRRTAFAEASGQLVAGQAGLAINDEVVREVAGVVETALPSASEALVRWLESTETRTELSGRARELLPRILEKLTDLQKLVLTAGQFDRRLNEKMPEIVDEIVRTLEQMARDPRQQQRLVGVFSDAARGWRDSLLIAPAAGKPQGAAREKLARAWSVLLGRLIGTLEDPEQRKRIAAVAAAALDNDRRTLGAFVRETLGIREEEAVERICAHVLGFLTRPETARELSERLVGLLAPDGETAVTVRDALRLDSARASDVEESIHAALPSVVERALPAVGRAVAENRGLGRLLGLLGAGAGLGAGLVVIALKSLGFQ